MLTRPKLNSKGIEIKAINQDEYKFIDRQFNWTKYQFFLGQDAVTQRSVHWGETGPILGRIGPHHPQLPSELGHACRNPADSKVCV